MPKDDELIERLNSFEISDALGNGDFSVCILAASRIAELKAERERLLEALWEIESFTYGYGDVAGQVNRMAAKARALSNPPSGEVS